MQNKIKPSEITPEALYYSRRRFIKNSITTAAASLLLTACGPAGLSKVAPTATNSGAQAQVGDSTDERGNSLTAYQDIISYTNFYEFSTSKTDPTQMAKDFQISPWNVHVGGLVNKPQTLDIDEILNLFDQEERIHRMRCVEAWSMVIPWNGFPLSKLIEIVEPKSEAKYVRFETLYDPEQMPGQKSPFYPWPYVEGLRMDEAMNDLTILATGIYGKDLTPQNGAPIRLVVPWKYGFKSIKSLVRIDFVTEMPVSLWMSAGPTEYGFYANVNPNVPHPRWSQVTERRIGEADRIDTLLFNGYEEEVAYLYESMDLTVNY